VLCHAVLCCVPAGVRHIPCCRYGRGQQPLGALLQVSGGWLAQAHAVSKPTAWQPNGQHKLRTPALFPQLRDLQVSLSATVSAASVEGCFSPHVYVLPELCNNSHVLCVHAVMCAVLCCAVLCSCLPGPTGVWSSANLPLSYLPTIQDEYTVSDCID
jgi:hypothetical protein